MKTLLIVTLLAGTAPIVVAQNYRSASSTTQYYRAQSQPQYYVYQPARQQNYSFQPSTTTSRTAQSTQTYFVRQQPVPRDPHALPPGTYAACGTSTGYYRPQPYTLSAGLPPHVVSAHGNYYAPVGSRQQYWYQYTPSTNTYGPREPNPFDRRGNLSIPRATNHVVQTRVIPWFQRLFSH